MKKAYIKYIAALILFGFNGIVAHHISLTSYEIVFFRTMIGSFLLMIIFFLNKGKCYFIQYKKQFFFLVVSGVAMGVSWMFLYEAYRQVGISIASLAYYCGPVIVMVLSPVIFRERLTYTKIIGFLAVLVGVFLVNGQVVDNGTHVRGLFFGSMSAIMYAIMVIFNKKAKDITGLEKSMLQLFISFLTVSIFIAYKQALVIRIPATDVIPILVLGLLNTGLGCYLYFSSIGDLPVQTVALCGYLEPLSAVVFSVIILKENLLIVQVVGATLIIGGAFFGELFMIGSKRNIQKQHSSI